MIIDKNKIATLLLGLLIVVSTTTLDAQAGRWDGADDLPVEPLACPGESSQERSTTVPYVGGQPENAPDLAGQDIILVNSPAEGRLD